MTGSSQTTSNPDKPKVAVTQRGGVKSIQIGDAAKQAPVGAPNPDGSYWEQLGVRGQIMVYFMAVLAVLSVGYNFWPSGQRDFPTGSDQVWFYDVVTGELYKEPLGTYGPVERPSGVQPGGQPAGVQAYVYSCGDCSEDERFVGFIKMHTPKYQNLMYMDDEDERDVALAQLVNESPHEGEYFAKPGPNPQWVQGSTVEGLNIMRSVKDRCPDHIIKCEP